jgi:LysM repeat protein
MKGQPKLKLLIFFLLLMSAALPLSREGLAQSETPVDLVNAVNDLRALHGLEPYQIDPWLMAYAQEHAEYQASIQTGTHLHSDGTLPLDLGLIENVAGGTEGVVTVAIVVYEIWVDWGHRHTLIGYSTGSIGAGMALSENGQVYYTVNVCPGEQSEEITSPLATLSPALPLVTSTPNENGSIIHTVRYGDTLWTIAHSYGVTVNDICRLNGIADDAILIYPGQNLLIRPASTIMPSPLDETISPTPTPRETTLTFTETLTPTQTAISSPTNTVTPSPTISAGPTDIPSSVLEGDGTRLMVILLIAVIGLLIVLIVRAWKQR